MGHELDRILHAGREARDGFWGVLSTGEQLAAALVLNRPDWLAKLSYTEAEAKERLGPTWSALIPEAARILENETPAGRRG